MVFCGPHLLLAFHFLCGPGGGEPQRNGKASGKFPFMWSRRRRLPSGGVFVGGPLLEVIVPLGTPNHTHDKCPAHEQEQKTLWTESESPPILNPVRMHKASATNNTFAVSRQHKKKVFKNNTFGARGTFT